MDVTCEIEKNRQAEVVLACLGIARRYQGWRYIKTALEWALAGVGTGPGSVHPAGCHIPGLRRVGQTERLPRPLAGPGPPPGRAGLYDLLRGRHAQPDAQAALRPVYLAARL